MGGQYNFIPFLVGKSSSIFQFIFALKCFIFCLEPESGMPEHQAQFYFKQLIDGLVSWLSFLIFLSTSSFSFTFNFNTNSALYFWLLWELFCCIKISSFFLWKKSFPFWHRLAVKIVTRLSRQIFEDKNVKRFFTRTKKHLMAFLWDFYFSSKVF